MRSFAVAVLAALVGAAAALHYHHLGLTLAHFDARAHLVVSRRVFDSLTPGWQQVGAVWLPLPHLINALPSQIDWLYRTGAFAVVVSILATALAAGAIAWLIENITGSIVGGAVAAALLVLNPNVLYLQSTPMSEPLLFGTTFCALALVVRWIQSHSQAPNSQLPTPNQVPTSNLQVPTSNLQPPRTVAAGWWLVAACLSRYEAWPITAAVVGMAAITLVLRGMNLATTVRRVRGLALWPLWTLAAFLVNSKISVGSWFVSSGFFVPDNPAMHHPWLAWTQVWDGLGLVAGSAIPWLACLAAVALVVTAVRSPRYAPLLLTLALAAAAALPWSAYLEGHQVRLRYDVPLVAAAAAIIGGAVALLPRRIAPITGAAIVALALWQAPPLDRNASVIVESLRDVSNSAGREAVTDYLRAHWDGQPIMMSMGSLAHYMHDLSADGFRIRDFLHEGNGEIWKAAVAHPRPFARWIAVEEFARGGDMLYWQGKRDPQFFAGYTRVAEGGNVALYRRAD